MFLVMMGGPETASRMLQTCFANDGREAHRKAWQKQLRSIQRVLPCAKIEHPSIAAWQGSGNHNCHACNMPGRAAPYLLQLSHNAPLIGALLLREDSLHGDVAAIQGLLLQQTCMCRGSHQHWAGCKQREHEVCKTVQN